MGVTSFPEVVIPAGMLMPSARSDAPSGWLFCDGSAVSRATYAELFAAVGIQYGAGDGSTTFNLPNLKGRSIVMQDAAQAEFDVLGEAGGAKTVALDSASLPSHNHAVTVDTNNFSSAGQSANHTHYVNGNNFNTGDIDRNHYHGIGHWHTGWIGNMHWNGTQTHGHHDRGGIASEAPWEGANWAGAVPINVDGTARGAPNGDNASGWVSQGHLHNANHDHGSSWVSVDHSHTANHNHTGSSATAGSGGAHSNLQPYLTMNYLIKT